MEKVDPTPNSLFTSSVPPTLWIISREIYRPNPEPSAT